MEKSVKVLNALVSDSSIAPHLAKLPERYRIILTRRLGLLGNESESVTDIARSMGISKQRISEMVYSGLDKLIKLREGEP